jgi:hypothetical protein
LAHNSSKSRKIDEAQGNTGEQRAELGRLLEAFEHLCAVQHNTNSTHSARATDEKEKE